MTSQPDAHMTKRSVVNTKMMLPANQSKGTMRQLISNRVAIDGLVVLCAYILMEKARYLQGLEALAVSQIIYGDALYNAFY